MPSKLNTYMLDELRSRFEDVEDYVVVTFSGIGATEMTRLRSAVRGGNGKLMVVKNSIVSRAFRELGRDEEFIKLFHGPVAIAFGDDPATTVRALSDWNKKARKLEFKGGIIGGRTVEHDAVASLATLPPMPVMQAMAIGSIAAPLTSFLGVCKEVVQSFVRIADQLARQERGDGESPVGAPAGS